METAVGVSLKFLPSCTQAITAQDDPSKACELWFGLAKMMLGSRRATCGCTVTTPQNPSSRNPAIGSIDFGGLLAPGVFWGEVGAKHLPWCLIYVVATGILCSYEISPTTLGFIQKLGMPWSMVWYGWYGMPQSGYLNTESDNQLLDLRHLSAGPWVLALRRAQKDPWCSWRSRSPCAYGAGNEMQGCMHTFVCRTTPSCILVGLANFGWKTSKNRS